MGDRITNLTKEHKQVISMQLEYFRERFGRDPLSFEPIFFDPKFDKPTPWSDERLKEIFKNSEKFDFSMIL